MNTNIRILPVGDRAVLVDLPNLDSALVLFQQLNANLLVGVTEIVPAAQTILVTFKTELVNKDKVSQWCHDNLRHLLAQQPNLENNLSTISGELVEIPVHYNGEDLGSVAEYLGISTKELIERHTGTDFIGAFAGFAPGFIYLSKGDPCFTNIPRLDTPRTRVPASSVAVAGDFSAIYPKVSPGGWRLLGTTPERMWDLNRNRPALIQPGFRVRFIDLDARHITYSLPKQTTAQSEPTKQPQADPSNSIEVISAGIQTLVQDFGRQGLTAMGVSASGALDKAAMCMANQLVGNPDDYPVLENALGGLQLKFHSPSVLAVTGADTNVILTTASGVRIPASANTTLQVDAGNILKIGRARSGMRFYIAVRGGFNIAQTLGSYATDTLAGLGPKVVRNNDFLAIYSKEELIKNRALTEPSMKLSARKTALRSLPKAKETVVLTILPGPRDDWFEKTALDNLLAQKWQVTAQSNRVGLRLQAEHSLKRSISAELPSEGTVAGAIQVPASGQPVLFLADHPLTGGYPVIAVVLSKDIDIAGQIPIGALIQFQLQEQDKP